jgi:hypothetical protein
MEEMIGLVVLKLFSPPFEISANDLICELFENQPKQEIFFFFCINVKSIQVFPRFSSKEPNFLI